MTPAKPILLMTRTPEASRQFHDRLPADLRARLALCVAPLIEIVPIAGNLEFDAAKTVIFTSANGVAIASQLIERHDLPAVCVGQATTEAAKGAGWRARCLGGSADELVQSLLAERAGGPMLHLGGRHTRGRIADRLSAAGCPTRHQPIYDQVLRPLGLQAKQALAGQKPVIVPLFSPRTARQFAEHCPHGAKPHVIALSPAVADALSAQAGPPVTIAKRPDAASMMACLQSVVNRLCRVESSGGAQ